MCCAQSLSRVWLFVALWTVASQAPLSRDSSGVNTGAGCHFLLQGIFWIQGLNSSLLHQTDRERHVSYDITYMQNLKENDTNELIYIQNWAKWIYTVVRVLRNSEEGAVLFFIILFISIQFSCSVMSNSLRPHGPQHARPPYPSSTPGVYPNSCPLSWWCHPTISSSVIPFSSCLQSFPALMSFPMSQLFVSGGQSIGVSALVSVLPMNIKGWFPWGLTGLISLLSKGLSRVFSNTTV